MKDTFWTDELVKEYASLYIKESWEQLGELKKNITSIEQFKSSKAPKKEWEIVAIKDTKHNEIVTHGDFSGFFREFPVGRFIIHSVRRLSDGEVFSVGDRVAGGKFLDMRITRFDIFNDDLEIGHENYGSLIFKSGELSKLRKIQKPIITTSDGKELYEACNVYLVDREFVFFQGHLIAFKPQELDEYRVFYEEGNARKYILDHAPLLSLNDVKEAAKNENWHTALIERLTALVKQKLNQ